MLAVLLYIVVVCHVVFIIRIIFISAFRQVTLGRMSVYKIKTHSLIYLNVY